jgi:hypothetical protein
MIGSHRVLRDPHEDPASGRRVLQAGRRERDPCPVVRLGEGLPCGSDEVPLEFDRGETLRLSLDAGWDPSPVLTHPERGRVVADRAIDPHLEAEPPPAGPRVHAEGETQLVSLVEGRRKTQGLAGVKE